MHTNRPETKPAREAKIVEYKAHDGQHVKLDLEVCKNFLVRGKAQYVTTQEFVFFMGVCKSRGVNPFAMDCYLIKYAQEGNAAIIVSRGHYQASAKQQPDCQGWSSGVIIKKGEGLEYREGHLVLEDEELVGGWFEAQPKNWLKPKRHTVPLAPYIKKTYKGEITQFWQPEKQGMMIEKVAEVQGLRSLWSREFANLHILEEMVEADSPTSLPPGPNDPGPDKPRGPETTKEAYKKEPLPPQPETAEAAGADPDDAVAMITQAQIGQIAAFGGDIIRKVLDDYPARIIGELTAEQAEEALKACHALKKALDEENVDDDALAILDKKIGARFKDCTLYEKQLLEGFLFIRTGSSLIKWTKGNLEALKNMPAESLVVVAHFEKWERFQKDGKIEMPWPVMPEAKEVTPILATGTKAIAFNPRHPDDPAFFVDVTVIGYSPKNKKYKVDFEGGGDDEWVRESEIRPAEAEPKAPTHFNCVGCLERFPAVEIVWGMDNNQPHCKSCMETEASEEPDTKTTKCERCGWDDGGHHEMCPDKDKADDPREVLRIAMIGEIGKIDDEPEESSERVTKALEAIGLTETTALTDLTLEQAGQVIDELNRF